jgi:hypothetical protein
MGDDEQGHEKGNGKDLAPLDPIKEECREAVRFFYDLQKLRIGSHHRVTTGKDRTKLSEKHYESLIVQSWLLKELEAEALGEVKRILKDVPIYKEWLKEQKGCGPTLSGVIVAEIDIRRAETPSALWKYCGLDVRICDKCHGACEVETDDGVMKWCEACLGRGGYAARRTRGEKAGYNPWLKAKLVKVLGECLIKANSPWRRHYDEYKHRKANTRVDRCMACAGGGTVVYEKKKTMCKNCGGTGGPAPWGRSDAHRHAAAVRKMVKMFLLGLWKEWRKLEGLPVVEPYAEAYLGRTHGDHAGAGMLEGAEHP